MFGDTPGEARPFILSVARSSYSKFMSNNLVRSLILIFSFSLVAAAQQSASDTAFPSASKERESSPLGSPEDELRQRAAIQHGEATYRESLARAREGAQLGAELRAAFEQNKAFTREDLKKLERLEKLARKIRSSAGGSDDDAELSDPPQRLDAALSRLSELSAELSKNVEKTSRLVVSASVIERCNELIELVRLIRTLPR